MVEANMLSLGSVSDVAVALSDLYTQSQMSFFAEFLSIYMILSLICAQMLLYFWFFFTGNE